MCDHSSGCTDCTDCTCLFTCKYRYSVLGICLTFVMAENAPCTRVGEKNDLLAAQ